MTNMPDMDLLREFASSQSEAAFAEIVRRHLPLVYSVARRCTGDDGHAQDVAQAVFVILARKAGKLSARTVLAGWLHDTAWFTATRLVRDQARRRAREQEAYMQSTLNEADTTDAWNRLEPHLEPVMARLSEQDRSLLVLRFYENKTGAEAAATLGIREDAAHKRLARALEKVRKLFARRGVALSASAIAAAISANSVQAAPAGLAALVCANTAKGAVIAASISTLAAGTVKTIAVATIQKTVLVTALAASVGVGLYEARQAANARAEIQGLQQEQAAAARQIASLKEENTRLSNLVANAGEQSTLSQAQFNELLKLRGQAGQYRTALAEMQKMRAAASQPAAGANADRGLLAQIIGMAQQAMASEEAVRLEKLKAALNLTPQQTQAISDLMAGQTREEAQTFSNLLSGNVSPDQLAKMNGTESDLSTEIKALLTPDQAAAYDQFTQTEASTKANASAKSDLADIMKIEGMELSAEQQDRIRAVLGEEALKAVRSPAAVIQRPDQLNADSIAASEQQYLDRRLELLQGILTPEQLKLYQQHEQAGITNGAILLQILSQPKSK